MDFHALQPTQPAKGAQAINLFIWKAQCLWGVGCLASRLAHPRCVYPNKLTIETAELLSSIKRVSIYANKTTHQIRLKIAGSELQITSEDLDFANKAEERLPCQYEGEDMEIGFNSKFVIDMLNNIGAEKISIEMSASNRAGIILPLDGFEDGENTLMLVMPVMLNS